MEKRPREAKDVSAYSSMRAVASDRLIGGSGKLGMHLWSGYCNRGQGCKPLSTPLKFTCAASPYSFLAFCIEKTCSLGQ